MPIRSYDCLIERIPYSGVICNSSGDRLHYKDDKLHRVDEPAVEYIGGEKRWYQNNLLHRLDGPAVENADGYKYWYLNGEHVPCFTNEEFLRIVKLKAFL